MKLNTADRKEYDRYIEEKIKTANKTFESSFKK